MTLIQFLKTLKSFEPGYQDSQSNNKDGRKRTRIKCERQLSREDFMLLKKVTKDIPEVVSINNQFEWTSSDFRSSFSRKVCCIYIIDKTPSQIKIN